MEAKTKKIIWVSIATVTIIGVTYLAWRQWGSKNPVFGKGKVDRQAKMNRVFNFRKVA